MTTYVPGTLETDLKKIIMSLQQIGAGLDSANANIAAKIPQISSPTLSSPVTVSCVTAGSIYMYGFGVSFTPSKSGFVIITGTSISAISSGAVNGDKIRTYFYYGTGTAPTNGAAATGTQYGLIQSYAYNSTSFIQLDVVTAVLLQLTPGTTYWFDYGAADSTTSSVTMSLNSSTLRIMEF